MDTIFRNTRSIFSVVRVAREQPRRYGKNGELLVEYAVTEERLRRMSRSDKEASTIHLTTVAENDPEK
jgi:hypothetical protein